MAADLQPVKAGADVVGIVDGPGRKPEHLAFQFLQAGEVGAARDGHGHAFPLLGKTVDDWQSLPFTARQVVAKWCQARSRSNMRCAFPWMPWCSPPSGRFAQQRQVPRCNATLLLHRHPARSASGQELPLSNGSFAPGADLQSYRLLSDIQLWLETHPVLEIGHRRRHRVRHTPHRHLGEAAVPEGYRAMDYERRSHVGMLCQQPIGDEHQHPPSTTAGIIRLMSC